MELNNVIIKDAEERYCFANLSIENGLIQKIELNPSNKDFSKADFYATPGFVNAHLHPNQLLDRRLLDGLNISDLLHGMHCDYKKTDHDRYVQAQLVLIEAIKSGATTIYAIATNPFPVIEAFKKVKVKGAITCAYNDQWEGFGDPPALSKLQAIAEKFEEAFKLQDENIAIHIGSASVESASNELLLLMDRLAKRLDTKVNIHVSEGSDSVQSCLKSRQLTPIRLLAKLGVLGPRWNLIHAATLDHEEIDLIGKHGASVTHCPVSNAKTGVGVAPIIDLMDRGVRIALGSDACSNNNTNNILNEAYFTLLVHSAVNKNAEILTVDTLMSWLTTQGHDIVGTGQRGILAVGEPADLLLWSLKESAFVPLAYGKFDEALIFNAPDIKPHTVLIDGNKIVENYTFLPLSEQAIREEANRVGAKIKANISQHVPELNTADNRAAP